MSWLDDRMAALGWWTLGGDVLPGRCWDTLTWVYPDDRPAAWDVGGEG